MEKSKQLEDNTNTIEIIPNDLKLFDICYTKNDKKALHILHKNLIYNDAMLLFCRYSIQLLDKD